MTRRKKLAGTSHQRSSRGRVDACSGEQCDQGWVRRLLPATLAGMLALFLAGCYTMLHHPRSQEFVESYPSGSCIQCHEEDGGYDARALPWIEYYGSSSTPWINYYGSPWWQDAHWVPHAEGDSELEFGGALELRSRVQARWRLSHGPKSDRADSTLQRPAGSPNLSPLVPAPGTHAGAPISLPAIAGPGTKPSTKKQDGSQSAQPPAPRSRTRAHAPTNQTKPEDEKQGDVPGKPPVHDGSKTQEKQKAAEKPE